MLRAAENTQQVDLRLSDSDARSSGLFSAGAKLASSLELLNPSMALERELHAVQVTKLLACLSPGV